MKNYIISILFLFLFTDVYSQNHKDLSYRIKSGDLTFEECMSFFNTERFPETIPSLMKLKHLYEIPEFYKGSIYYYVSIVLYTYYIGVGDILAARTVINEAISTCSQREKEANNEWTRPLLNCRGQLEKSLNNYDEALYYLHLAYRYFEEANDYGEQYLNLLTNIGHAYLGKGDILSCKLYMDEMKEVFEQLYGNFNDIKEDDQYIFLAHYALMLHSIGHESEAEMYYLNVINHCNRIGASLEAYLMSVIDLSVIYSLKGRWKESVDLLQNLKTNNSFYNSEIQKILIMAYLFTNRYKEAFSLQRDMNNTSLSNIERVFSDFTVLERDNYWNKTSAALTNINNLIALRTNDGQAISMAYDNTLVCKTLTTKAPRILYEYITKNGSEELVNQYHRYQVLKNDLQFKSKDSVIRDSLRTVVNHAERMILSSASDLGLWIKQEYTSWANVKKSLGKGEIAIEYCHLPATDTIPISDFRYGAFILRSDDIYPVLIPLDKIEVVNKLFHNDNSDPFWINDLYSSPKAKNLYEMLWQKLVPYLDGIKTVYYSPTGPLANLNFNVLHGEDGKMLNEKYKMVRVSSTANISEMKAKEKEPSKSSVLYGNIKYDESTKDMEEASSAYNKYSGTEIQSELALRSENERGKWGPIPATKIEINDIGNLLSQKRIKVIKYEENAANEESFKALSGDSPDIIHLATHGFVIDTPQRAKGNKFVATTNIYSQKESYMLWAGLMLAGGNNIWQGNFNLTNVEDGILTADEISQLDLSNTKLVVLSACETAKGKIDPVDGVYGLQRAFKMAGAQTIVMSLWKVQDDATSLLMTQFYTYLTDGVERHQALWKAMMDVREKYPDPYYWAGFIMLD